MDIGLLRWKVFIDQYLHVGGLDITALKVTTVLHCGQNFAKL